MTLRLLGLALLVAVSYALAFALRFDFQTPSGYQRLFWLTLPWFAGLKAFVVGLSLRRRSAWSYLTFKDLLAWTQASLVAATLAAFAGRVALAVRVPVGVLALEGLLTMAGLALWQSGGAVLFRWQRRRLSQRLRRPALLVGTGQAYVLLAHQVNSSAHARYLVRGLLGIHPRTAAGRCGEIPIVGALRDLPRLAAAQGIDDVLVVAGSLPGRRMRRLMAVCDRSRLALRIVPPLEDLFNGNRWLPMRDLDTSDLLRRRPVELDHGKIGELLSGRRVLVTGAGGSIGSEICRHVLRFAPAELLLLGRGENRIYAIERELAALHSGRSRLAPAIGNITDVPRMRDVFEQFRPEVIFHAAAHKHVPLMEAHVAEAVRNNVLGTKCLADLAAEYDVKSFVLISTDKAVNPTSVMGATKHLAERYVQAMSQRSATQFVAVRLGNVLGSAGSVVPLFREQIRRGGPITVTDPRMTRYFMTIPEASQLVLQAAAMGAGGEVFVLDMGDPVCIVDLARDLVRLSGLPADSIDIAYTQARPGEKLHEELYARGEQRRPTAHAKVHVARQKVHDPAEVDRLMSELARCLPDGDAVVLGRLRAAIAEFRPDATAGQGFAGPIVIQDASCHRQWSRA